VSKALGLSLVITLVIVGCNNKEWQKYVPSAQVGDEPQYVSSPSSENIKEGYLKEIVRDLARKYLRLKNEWDNKDFYELGKEILMYEDLFPSRGNYEDYEYEILNERMVNYTKLNDIHYSFDIKESFTYEDGTTEISEDSITLSIIQDKDGKYKIALVL
jgi:hypothetical protein